MSSDKKEVQEALATANAKPLSDSQSSNKPIVYGFMTALALAGAAGCLQKPLSLWDALNGYGFMQVHQKEAIEYLLKQSGIKNEEIQTLLHSKTNKPEALLENIIKFVELTQKHFVIRTGAQERWEVEATEWMKNEAEQTNILKALQSTAMIDEILPSIAKPDAVCILGARNSAMKLRLGYAGKLFDEKKLSANLLLLLAGERYVTFNQNGESIDGSKQELNLLAENLKKRVEELTETDLIRASYESSIFFKLSSQLPVVVIDTPKRDLPRPTTETTMLELIQWLKKNPKIKTITFVSNQPHVKYQKAIIDMVLKREGMDLQIDVIGPAFTLSNKPTPTEVKDLVGALGSQIYAQTLSVIESLEIKVEDDALKERLMKLYKGQPLIFNNIKPLLK